MLHSDDSDELKAKRICYGCVGESYLSQEIHRTGDEAECSCNRPSNPVPRRCRGLQRSTTCLSSPNDTRQPGSFSQSTLAVF